MIRWKKPMIQPTPKKNIQRLALGETELLVARQWCKQLNPTWLSSICESAKTLIYERLTMLVEVDSENTWSAKYQDPNLESIPGTEGDFVAMTQAVKDPIFVYF